MSNDESQQGATMEGFADQAQRFSQAQKRFGFTVSRPVAVMVIFLTGLVFGTFSLLRLPVNLMPALNYPKITVRAEYPGAAPAEVENDVARPLEEVMGVIAGVTKISSIARPNGADIVMEFGWATNMKDATTDVLEKLDMARGALPDQVKTPTILRYDPNLDPILVLSLSGDAPAYEGEAGAVALRKVGEREVKRLLEPLAGVASVKIRGGLSEEMHVDLDEDALMEILGESNTWDSDPLRSTRSSFPFAGEPLILGEYRSKEAPPAES